MLRPSSISQLLVIKCKIKHTAANISFKHVALAVYEAKSEKQTN